MSSIKRRAALSGFFGATASLIGKIALDPESPIQSSARGICSHFATDLAIAGRTISSPNICTAIELGIRGVCLLLMIATNAIMISSFLDGMNESGTVAGTALANAANFSMSAIYGYLFFHERMNATWMVGFAMIISGAWVLSTVKLKKDEGESDDDETKKNR